MTPAQLNHYRAVLLKHREVLKAPPREDMAITRHADPVDQVQADSLRAQAEAAANRVDRRVREIDEALGRIKDGSYGECADCGEEIAVKRLNAVPWAARCIGCQEAWDERRRG